MVAELRAVAGQTGALDVPYSRETRSLGKRYVYTSVRDQRHTCRPSVRSFSSSSTAEASRPPWLFARDNQPASKETTVEQAPKGRDSASRGGLQAPAVPKETSVNGLKQDTSPNSASTTDTERRQRSLEQSASTSATAEPKHRQAKGATQSAPTAGSPRSQYAQKASAFGRKLGNTPIRDLLQTQQITLPDYSPGQKRAQCPKCAGGSTHEESLALNISEDSQSAKWICHRATCGWEGGVDQGAGQPSNSWQALCGWPCWNACLLSTILPCCFIKICKLLISRLLLPCCLGRCCIQLRHTVC